MAFSGTVKVSTHEGTNRRDLLPTRRNIFFIWSQELVTQTVHMRGPSPRDLSHEFKPIRICGTSCRDQILVPATTCFTKMGSSHKRTWFPGLVTGTSPLVCVGLKVQLQIELHYSTCKTCVTISHCKMLQCYTVTAKGCLFSQSFITSSYNEGNYICTFIKA